MLTLLLAGLTSAAGCSREAREPAEADVTTIDSFPAGELQGSIKSTDGSPLQGVMITAHDSVGHRSVTVFSDPRGQYRFPRLRPQEYRIQAKRIGLVTSSAKPIDLSDRGKQADFTLAKKADFRDQLSAVYYNNLLVKKWPSPMMRDDFSLSCAGCHQVGNYSYRLVQTKAKWDSVIQTMLTEQQAPPLVPTTREHIVDTMLKVFGKDAPTPRFERPALLSGPPLDSVIREYEISPEGRADDCHDAIVASSGIVYTERGFALNPDTLERRYFPIRERGHSLQEAPDGKLWITVTRNDPDVIARLDPETGEITYFQHPVIEGEKVVYPHTLRFDDDGNIWYTLTASNHVARFEPDSAEFTYYNLPTGSEGELPVPEHPVYGGVPTAYGLDVAPDGGIWWSQLLAQRIGRIDPETGELQSWATPVAGPRRLRAGADGIIWVPFFGPSRLGRFEPESGEWTLYELPTGDGELPYALAVHPDTGAVWITGSNSDAMIRFDPKNEQFSVYPLPTPNSYMRDIVFDEEGNIWSCTSARAGGHPDALLGQPRLIKLEPGANR